MRVVVATANRGKLAEIERLLADLPAEVVGLADLAPVDFPAEGDEYGANAAEKARAAARQLGLLALAAVATSSSMRSFRYSCTAAVASAFSEAGV